MFRSILATVFWCSIVGLTGPGLVFGLFATKANAAAPVKCISLAKGQVRCSDGTVIEFVGDYVVRTVVIPKGGTMASPIGQVDNSPWNPKGNWVDDSTKP